MALGFFPVLAMRSLIAVSSRSGSIFHVSASESTNTGVAPRYVTGWLDAQNVNDCTSTSSPGPTPQAIRARCTAAVPADSATTFLSSGSASSQRFPDTSEPSQWFTLSSEPSQWFTNASRSFSKPLTFGPRGTTQLSANASFIKSISLPLICARHSSIRSILVLSCLKLLYYVCQ